MYIYDFAGYCKMIQDEKRMQNFAAALKHYITPHTIVLEIGAGTGVFTYLACKFGAKKVIAIEANPIIQIAREAIFAAGFSDKVEFIEKLSTEVELETKADLLLCDLHGNLPFFETGITTIIDARERLLKENAVFMPSNETVYFAVVECEDAYNSEISKSLASFADYKIPAANKLLTNRMLNVVGKDQNLLSGSEVFAKLDYKAIESPNAHNKVRLIITKKGTAHGIRTWFVAEHGKGFFTDNSIETPNATYGQPIFPFEKPISVEKNDVIEFEVNATLEKGHYIFSWNTQIFDKSGVLKYSFRQTTLANQTISPKNILKQSEYFIPKLNAEAEIQKYILELCDGEQMNGDITDALLLKFPDKFKDFDEALVKVAEIATHFTT